MFHMIKDTDFIYHEFMNLLIKPKLYLSGIKQLTLKMLPTMKPSQWSTHTLTSSYPFLAVP